MYEREKQINGNGKKDGKPFDDHLSSKWDLLSRFYSHQLATWVKGSAYVFAGIINMPIRESVNVSGSKIFTSKEVGN